MPSATVPRRRRIGYLVSRYPATSHTFIRREVEELRRRGLSIDTFSVRRPEPAERTAPADKAAFDTSCYVLPLRPFALLTAHLAAIFTHPAAYARVFVLALRHRAPGLRALLWSLFHFVESIALARELRARGIDHLHNHFANSGATVGLLASRFLGLPWSLTLHGISETDYPAGLLLAEKIANAEFVACVSWFGRAQAMRLTPLAQWPKFMIVRCGLNLAEIDALSYRAQGSDAIANIICVGRLSSEKGHFGLIESFAALRAQGIAARLTLVGDGPQLSALRDCVAALGLGKDVAFAGRLGETETLDAIARADLLVLPSFMEGLPVVLIEAMALGVPVVASRVAGIPELIAEGRSGLLFTPARWDELRDAMAQVLANPEGARAMAEAARNRVEAEFDIAVAVAPLIARYEA